MLINVVLYSFASEDADRAQALFLELRDLARAEPGCIGFEVARGDDRTKFALWETYENQAALDAHYETEHFDRLGRNGIRALAKSRTAEVCQLL